MKRTTLFITLLVLMTSVTFSQNKVNINNLVQYGDKWFKENDDKPYSGTVFNLSKRTGKMVLECGYVNGQPDGKYTEWYEDGTLKIEGFNKSGKMERSWTYYHENGKKNGEGSFVNGDGGDVSEVSGVPRNGRDSMWTFYFNNGNKETELEYKNGQLNGKSTTWYENGNKQSESEYMNGQLNGKRSKWYENGNKEFEGNIKNEKLVGLYTTWYENGVKSEISNLVEGTRHGEMSTWYENGNKENQLNFKNGKMDGFFTTWYENGNKKTQGNQKNEILDGLYTKWYENGNKETQENYKNEELDGLQTMWYENGVKSQISNLVEGTRQGELSTWYENGNKRTQLNYKDGKLDGLSTTWYENVQVERKGVRVNGEWDGLVEDWKEDGTKYLDRLFDQTNDDYHLEKTYYYPDGKKKFIQKFRRSGNRLGIWTYFLNDTTKFEGNYGQFEWWDDEITLLKSFSSTPNPGRGTLTSFYENGNKNKEINNETGERKYFYEDGRVLFETEVTKRNTWSYILELGGYFQDKEGNQFVGPFYRPPEDYVLNQSVDDFIDDHTEGFTYPPDGDYFYFLGRHTMNYSYSFGIGRILGVLDDGTTIEQKFEDKGYEDYSISPYSYDFEKGLERQVCYGSFKKSANKVGKHQCFYETGELLWEVNYTISSNQPFGPEDYPTGPFIVYWKNGNKKIEGQYNTLREYNQPVQKSGIWKLFDENGKVFDEIMF